jgi:4-hydroxy-3-methylbut-2-enyl diphosphate reductase IspH
MNVETIVNDVKDRVEPIIEQGQEFLAHGQEVVLAGFETLKSANAIVVEGVQALAKTQFEAGKDLFAVAQTSFEKARTDGLKAVAADPIAYLPEGKERVLSAYNDSVAVVSKTGDDARKTVRAAA